MINPYLQQWFTVHAVAESALSPDRVLANYRNLGGRCDGIDVEAYLQGLLPLDNLQRDMLSHAINELLDDAASPARRAAYTTDDVSLETGAIAESSFESCTDAALKRLVTASRALFMHDDRELRRLESLGRTGLMGTPAEERFDRITREAQRAFGVSSSSLALIGEHQQFIKSLAGPIGQNLPRAMSFCNETICHNHATVVRDALTHERFRSNPLVQRKPHIRFYAGYPLTGPGGWRIGTLCIIDDKPRKFTGKDEMRLLKLASRAQDELNHGEK